MTSSHAAAAQSTPSTSLYRPGPINSGMTDRYLKSKRSGAFKVLHPDLTPVLGPTYGVPVFQEQIMRVAEVFAGYAPDESDSFRRCLGRQKPEELAHHRAIFMTGAARLGRPTELCGEVFRLLEEHARFTFNKSHSVAYSMVAFRSAWLKANHPAEFAACSLALAAPPR